MGRADGYAPIEDYAAIGNGETVALIARDGSVDWLPLPRLDGPTVFARLLDPDRGGAFELAPDAEFEVERRYRDDSNVLETTFTTAEGRVRITDAIPLDHGGLLPWFELARRIEGVSGRVPMRWRITPRFGAGEDEQAASFEKIRDAVVAKTQERYLAVRSYDAGDIQYTTEHIGGTFDAVEGSSSLIVLRSAHDEPIPFPRRDWVERRIDETVDDWTRWLADAGVEGEWREATRRSALALRVLTYARTGAVAAAATTSLPEAIGGDRNYDYRYAWVRDTTFTLDALLNLGLLVQVHASFTWLLRAIARTSPNVCVFYDLDGETATGEKTVTLAGYRRSSPVRRGNEAAHQRQLDSYGDLLETAELYVRDGNSLGDATKEWIVAAVDELASIWDEKDSGIWELPDEEHYTSSKLAAWTAFDRALRLVERDELPADRAEEWLDARREVRAFVERECWSDDRHAYAMYPGTTKLDASVLRIARTGFLHGGADRLHATIDAIRDELTAGGPLLYRYSGQNDVEGAFVACSFWLVEALARAGRPDEARATMREMVARANDVGLFAEEIDPRTGEFLGNFPQGLSHLALITAAAAIAEQSR